MSESDFVLALVAAFAAFTLSAAAGLGGSLILVPALALILGTKEGVALAALLLAANNAVKLVAYRRTVPIATSAGVIALTIVGTALGARLLVEAPSRLVEAAVVLSIALSLVAERFAQRRVRRASAPGLAFASGTVSGFSGTSGPLKGLALRSLDFDRFHLVGAASAVSLAGDLTKTAVFAEASLLGADSVRLTLVAAPLMVVATLTGRRLNRNVGERGYAMLFWAVMGGYSVRLAFGWS